MTTCMPGSAAPRASTVTPGRPPPWSSVTRPTTEPVVCARSKSGGINRERRTGKRIGCLFTRTSFAGRDASTGFAVRLSRPLRSVVVNSRNAMKLFRRASEPAPSPATAPMTRLHIGCGQEAIPGWINIDNRELPGVDRVLDVRQGLPFQNVSAIYAEHFLEHLALEDGL